MHKDWCGKSCSDCKTSCALDESLPCSPDCKYLGENGETTCADCQECDSLRLFRVPVCYDGFVLVRAECEQDARDRICGMTADKMYRKSNGTWDIGNAEVED